MQIGLRSGTLPAQINVYLMFYIYALALGSIFPRLGDLQLKMHLGEAALGLALLGFALGTQISLAFANTVLKYVSARKIILISIPFLSFTYIIASYAHNSWQLFLCLIFSGLAIGCLEVVINLEADRTEFKIGKRIMNRSHAFWSLGFFSAGILGAWAGSMNIDSHWHFTIITVMTSIGCWLVFNDFQCAPPRPNNSNDKQGFVLPSKGIIFICLFTLSAMLLEGAGADWSIIFMRDNFNQPVFVNGLAFILGALSQAICRFFADSLVERLGAVKVSKISIATLGAGALLITFSPNAFMALLGFSLAGAGTACIFPLAMSAAAQRTDRPATVNLASLAQISFVVFLLAPPLLGFIAEAYGIRFSFALSIPLIILSWFSISSLVASSNDNNLSKITDSTENSA
ncbi:MAG: MFS transporter [Oceanospirillaceae bacterium]|nr:MFS transporter [Oceanospirillaceae bacterium]